MSAVLAPASPRRIKATHRRRRKIASGRFVQRYYDPQIGRFLSTDPVPADPDSGANFNSYWYADNNPMSLIDPDGRKADDPNKPNSEPPKPECDAECKRRKREQEARERNSDMVIQHGSDSNSSGFRIPGTESGAEAAQQWADLQVQTGNDLYAIPGALASLWTPETATDTALTLGGGAVGRPIAWAGNWAGRSMYVSKLLGPAGSVLGRTKLGGSSFLGMNSRFSQLRFGWGWAGTPKRGFNVLRISGDWIKAIGVKSGHIDLWTSPVIVTP